MKQSRRQTRENNDFFFLFSFFLLFSDLDGAFGVYRLAQEQPQPDLVGPENTSALVLSYLLRRWAGLQVGALGRALRRLLGGAEVRGRSLLTRLLRLAVGCHPLLAVRSHLLIRWRERESKGGENRLFRGNPASKQIHEYCRSATATCSAGGRHKDSARKWGRKR